LYQPASTKYNNNNHNHSNKNNQQQPTMHSMGATRIPAKHTFVSKLSTWKLSRVPGVQEPIKARQEVSSLLVQTFELHQLDSRHEPT
jgi:hypothetical protein